jgi:hypothetical protein
MSLIEELGVRERAAADDRGQRQAAALRDAGRRSDRGADG